VSGGGGGAARAPILIAGAGIGGLSAAILLRRAGFEVEVFERAPEVRELGAGISLWMNAMLALREIGVEPEVRAAAAPFDRSEMLTWKGTRLRRLALAGLADELGARPVGIGRPELLKALHQATAGIPIHTSSRCVGFEQDGEGVTLRLADGREVRGSALVGADGVHSAIRAQLLAEEPPQFIGMIEWRGISGSNLGAEAERGSLFSVFGPGSVSGVCWYIDQRRISWSVGTLAPQPGGDELANRDAVMPYLAGWRGPLPRLVESTADADIHLTNHVYRPIASPWGQGRVTLLGDAAHALSTVFGQGGAQTLEDAVAIADSLARHRGEITAGLRHYEQRRDQRVRQVAGEVMGVIRLLSLARDRPPGSWWRALVIRFLPAAAVLGPMRRIMTVPDRPPG
jgi:2-polyprenyl-6-methoxyphenol hydroxylase-like FAD-dependent oxidoreductase